MSDEDGFLQKLRDNPADDTTRLVYADWLSERGDPESAAKAEFLRLTVRLLEPNRSAGWRKGRRQDLQPLAAALPTEWLAVVSRLKVENCAEKRAEALAQRRLRQMFEFVCDKRWDELTATDDDAVRSCGQCKENVHYCDTITEARQSAALGRCIAVDLGVIRRHDDLSPRRHWVGRPSAEMLRKEDERCQVDAVSQAREEAKRKRRGDGEPPAS